MQWIQRLFGGGTDAVPFEPEAAGDARVTIEPFGQQIVLVREINFIGRCASSPNGRFQLLWRDHFFVEEERRSGRYVLIEDGRVLIDRPMERPQDGKISDDGTFILNDWGSEERVASSFHAFARDGRSLFERRFTARLFNNGLSNDGRLAVCQTCGAPGSPDNSVLCVFDLAALREVARWGQPSEWADSYEFAADGSQLRLIRRNRVVTEHSFGADMRVA